MLIVTLRKICAEMSGPGFRSGQRRSKIAFGQKPHSTRLRKLAEIMGVFGSHDGYDSVHEFTSFFQRSGKTSGSLEDGHIQRNDNFLQRSYNILRKYSVAFSGSFSA